MSRTGSPAADLAAPRAGRSRAPAPGTATGRQAFATAGTDEKRERIMAVAARLFFEHGYASTTIARQWDVLARIDNLGGKNYQLAAGYPALPRTFFVGLRWTGR